MFNSRIAQQLKVFFLEQHVNLGFVDNQFIRVDIIISKILQDPELNASFGKIIFPNMGIIKISAEKWIAEIIEAFLASKTAQQILETYKNQDIHTSYVKLLCFNNKVICDSDTDQYYQQRCLLSGLINDIILQHDYPYCPLSVIKQQLAMKLSENQQLKIDLQPLLTKLTSKKNNSDGEICFYNGDLVRYLRKINFLDSYKSVDEIYFYLKKVHNPQAIMFTRCADVEYNLQKEHSYEQVDDNNSFSISIRSTRSCP